MDRHFHIVPGLIARRRAFGNGRCPGTIGFGEIVNRECSGRKEVDYLKRNSTEWLVVIVRVPMQSVEAISDASDQRLCRKAQKINMCCTE